MTLVMGILNVTPDSFSDGGQHFRGGIFDCDAAVARGLALVDEGADVVDVGGESSRPGAEPVDADEECRRVLPVVRALAGRVRVSIDTVKPAVAVAAVEAGATLVNDISASLYDVAADVGAGWVAMHMQGTPATMQRDPRYDDVVREVRDFCVERAERARQAGVEEVWVDPGIGFGKTAAHNLALLRHLDQLVATGFPVLVGTSRKAFLGRSPVSSAPEQLPPTERSEASLATGVWASEQGAAMLRVHDVRAAVQAVRLLADPAAPTPDAPVGAAAKARSGVMA